MTPLRWRRLGKVFDPARAGGWMRSHAQNPTPLLRDDRIRVYCNMRPAPDENGAYTARIAWVDLDRTDPTRVLAVSDAPILPLGGRGEFDEFGTMVQGVADRPDRGEIWLYYVGWTRKVSVPFDWAIGLAISRDGGATFTRHGRGPIIGATAEEPFLHACPHVRRVGERWAMWYGAGLEWRSDEIEPIYRIFHAVSDDGVAWRREGRPCLPTVVDAECQTSPTLIQRDGEWLMLFSYRYGVDFRSAARGYRIGCARSADLETWTRDDDLAGFDVADSGWDAEMVCYPYLFEDGARTLLFYCGDDFGRGGFGVAQRDD